MVSHLSLFLIVWGRKHNNNMSVGDIYSFLQLNGASPEITVYFIILKDKVFSFFKKILSLVFSSSGLVFGFLVQASYLTKFMFLSYSLECSSPIRLQGSLNCNISCMQLDIYWSSNMIYFILVRCCHLFPGMPKVLQNDKLPISLERV